MRFLILHELVPSRLDAISVFVDHLNEGVLVHVLPQCEVRPPPDHAPGVLLVALLLEVHLEVEQPLADPDEVDTPHLGIDLALLRVLGVVEREVVDQVPVPREVAEWVLAVVRVGPDAVPAHTHGVKVPHKMPVAAAATVAGGPSQAHQRAALLLIAQPEDAPHGRRQGRGAHQHRYGRRGVGEVPDLLATDGRDVFVAHPRLDAALREHLHGPPADEDGALDALAARERELRLGVGEAAEEDLRLAEEVVVAHDVGVVNPDVDLGLRDPRGLRGEAEVPDRVRLLR
mmetsp:Transcript_35114/g.81537  ORF Transcript_35114/g.81537 Transcript_35114/m.81537 type:complete len:287 (-) Transcript_35114:290-1150(-)